MLAVIPWGMVMTSLILVAWVFFGGLIDATTKQSDTLKAVEELHSNRLRTHVAISSTNVLTSGTGDCGTLLIDTLLVNSGDVSITEFSDVDLVLVYTGDSGSKVFTHPLYVSGDLALDRWTVQGISPDDFNVKVLDPYETATLRARPASLPQTGSLGTVAVATPNGITDSAYVDFDYTGLDDCRYLHNNPTPPTANTNRQAVLPMDDSAPTATTLYNYDVDVDTDLGRTIQKGGSGAGETDVGKYQAWRTGVLSQPLSLSGTIAVDIWGAIQNYQLDKAGIVTIYFRDYNGSTYTEIGQGTLFDVDWQAGPSSFVRKVILIPGFSYTVPAGNELEVKMIVGSLAAAEMWFAYDTTTYNAQVNLSYVEPTFTTFYYLHDNPTPPTGDRAAQATLPMNGTAPTAAILYNYDTDFDSDAGRKLQKTPLGLSETELSKHQVWRSGAVTGDLAITGDVTIDLWAGTISFDQDKLGVVTVYLRDYDGATHQEIGQGSVYVADWQAGSSTFVKRSIIIPEVSYTVSSGDELDVFVVVENQAAGDMWFAYDTTSHPAVVKIP